PHLHLPDLWGARPPQRRRPHHRTRQGRAHHRRQPRLRLPAAPPAARGRVECQTIQARACGVDQPQRAHLHAPTTREPRPAPRPHARPPQRYRPPHGLPPLRTGPAHRPLHDTRPRQTPTTTTRAHTAATGARRRHPTVLAVPLDVSRCRIAFRRLSKAT